MLDMASNIEAFASAQPAAAWQVLERFLKEISQCERGEEQIRLRLRCAKAWRGCGVPLVSPVERACRGDCRPGGVNAGLVP